jgi:hypothetical protein
MTEPVYPTLITRIEEGEQTWIVNKHGERKPWLARPSTITYHILTEDGEEHEVSPEVAEVFAHVISGDPT